jgi:hypothetical protein
VALMEIVSKPDMRSPDEAGAYVRKLRAILRYVGSCDGNMDQGSMRADVNVSVRKAGAPFGTRTETKNVNSVRFVMAAIEHEARRQIELIESGGAVVQETRLFDPDRGVTRSMRSKEDAHDYRYFPDPDLLPLELTEAFVAECLASLPELPDAKRARYEASGVPAYNAAVITADVETARWFEALVEATGKPFSEVARAASNWLTSDLFGALNRLGREIGDSPVSHRTRRGCSASYRMDPVRKPRQAGVRDHAGDRREPSSDRRGARSQADQRHRRHRGGDRRHPRRECRKGSRVSRRQGQAVRLLRRPDHESDGGQGEPGRGQRPAEKGARLI